MDETVTAREHRPPADPSAAVAGRVVENLRRVIHAPEETLDLAVLCLLAEGHLII